MYFKFIFKELGGHTHFKVFSGATKGSLGLVAENAVFRNEEWSRFRTILEGGDTRDEVEFEKQVTSGLATRENNGFHPD